MVWSGVTKYMKTVTQVKCKPVEFPGLGIFLPVLLERGKQSQSQKLTENALKSFDPTDLDVKMLLNMNFLKGCGPSLNIPDVNSQDSTGISTFDPTVGEHHYIQGIHHINLQAIAQVCETDMLSVETILKEIVAQMKSHIKQGMNLRLMLKIGRLIIRNGTIQWKSFKEEDIMNRTYTNGDAWSRVTSQNSRAMVGSVHRKDLSVMTPSVNKSVRTQSLKQSDRRSFHMANPNPQPFGQKFKGVRDLGYQNMQIDPADIVKFGKRVDFQRKLTSDEVMQEHLRQIRQKMEISKLSNDLKRKQEREFLEQIKRLEELEEQRQKLSKDAINKDFVFYNEKIKNEKAQSKNYN